MRTLFSTAWWLLLGGVAALLLAVFASGGGESSSEAYAWSVEAPVTDGKASGAPDPERPLTESGKVAGGKLTGGVSSAPSVQLHRHMVSSRGRPGAPSGAQSAQRALLARQDALSAALAYRYSAAPVASGYVADRPTIVIQPLRGPPARA